MDGVLAAILESDDPQRLYTGLSLLVSAASAGEEARGLLTFGALGAILDPELEARARESATHVVAAEREAFARTLAALRATAFELPECRIWVCSAALEANGLDRAAVPEDLAGVTSIPQFVRDCAQARLVLV